MKSWKLSRLMIGGLIVATTCLSASIAHAISVPAKGEAIEDFIPAGWELESQAAGDLNGDGQDDLALRLIESGGPRYGRPRSLVVLLNTKTGWQRLAVADNLLLCDGCGGMLGDIRMQIRKQVLITDQLAGSRNAIKITHRFWIDQKLSKLVCIGEDLDPYDRANGNAIEDSRNFLTGKRIVIYYRGDREGDGKARIVKTENLKVSKKLRPIESMSFEAARESALDTDNN